MKIQIMILLLAVFVTTNIRALSATAEEGKNLFQTCNACHNQALDPAKAPPIWGVKKRYLKVSTDNNDFIKKMVSFVKAPTLEKAIHEQGVKQLGLMPAMPLGDDNLMKIVTYILEEKFSPPCEHWQMAINKAKESGNSNHAKKDQKQFNKFCK